MSKRKRRKSLAPKYDISGQTIGRHKIIGLADQDKTGRWRWHCECLTCGFKSKMTRKAVLRVAPQSKRTKHYPCECFRFMPTEARFWASVNKLPGDGCWEWTRYIGKEGYGALTDGSVRKWAHRYSYEITHGPIPEGMLICHHCDNRRCVRPDHLFLGTKLDNALDMAQKGRHGNSKITPSQARDIYRRYLNGLATIPELASEYRISEWTITNVIQGRSYGHTTGAPLRKYSGLIKGISPRPRKPRAFRFGVGPFARQIFCSGENIDRLDVASRRRNDEEYVQFVIGSGESRIVIQLSPRQAAELRDKLGEQPCVSEEMVGWMV